MGRGGKQPRKAVKSQSAAPKVAGISEIDFVGDFAALAAPALHRLRTAQAGWGEKLLAQIVPLPRDGITVMLWKLGFMYPEFR